MELLAFASFAALIVAWIAAPTTAKAPVSATLAEELKPAEQAA